LLFAKPLRILLFLETGYVVIGKANQSSTAGATLSEYLLKPEVESIVEIDVCQ
jgi:hypothetical protein